MECLLNIKVEETNKLIMNNIVLYSQQDVKQ